jgi:hypothetical protein
MNDQLNIPSSDKKIHVLKMMAGDLIVGEVVISSDEESFISLKKPHVIVQDQGGKMALLPYLQIFEGDIIPFNKCCVEINKKANSQVITSYLKLTTGLDLPIKPKLLLETN